MSTIPIDIVLEIFSRLPAKSIKRFHCVSKQLNSMLSLPCFTELFLTRSCARPRLLFALQGTDENWSVYSSPQPHNLYGESSLEVTADFHMNFKRTNIHRRESDCPTDFHVVTTTSGLISVSSKSGCENTVICNPSTGQYASLPHATTSGKSTIFLGFDPIGKQFKLLSSCFLYGQRVLTLGSGDMRWRKIQSPVTHWPLSEWICINGVLYYLATRMNAASYVIVCFDVCSEEFKFIDEEWFCGLIRLINYKGKLGGITFKYEWSNKKREWPLCESSYLRMWVLDDVEKQEWFKYEYTLPGNCFGGTGWDVSVAGVIATGEVVLSKDYTYSSKPFSVFYFHPERNTLKTVEIQGFGDLIEALKLHGCRVYTFVDHVENLNVPDAKLLSSIPYI